MFNQSYLEDSYALFKGTLVMIYIEQTPKRGIPPNIAPKIVTPENYLQI